VFISSRTCLLVLLLVAAGGAVWGQADAEATCERERAALFDEVRQRRSEGAEVRQDLIDRIRSLIERYPGSAPICVGRSREHEAYLYVMDRRYDELVSITGRYLEGPGQHTSVRSRVLLLMQRGYALDQLGRTLESARSFYTAASMADEAPVMYGGRALIEAGRVARVLGEFRESESYFRAALDLIDDSLGVAPEPPDLKGHALTSYSILTDLKLRSAVTDAERDSLVGLLATRTSDALDVLSKTGQSAGYRSVVLSLSAVAAAHQGDFDRARAHVRQAPPLAREAGLLAPEAPFEALIAEGRIAEIAGDLEDAAEAYNRGRKEALRNQSPRSEALALEHLGQLAERRGRWAEAADYFEQAVERREIERDRLGLDDWSSSAFATMQGPYRGLVRTQLATGDVRGAFQTLDRTRARYLRDLLHYQDVRETLRPDTRNQIDSVVEKLSATRLAYLQASSASDRAARRLETSAYQRQIEELTASGPEARQIADLDLDALKRRLAIEERTLITYFVDDTRSTAFVLCRDTLVSVPLPVTRAMVQERLEAIGWPWRPGHPDPAYALPPLHELYDLLIAPVRPWVPTQKVTIIPDIDIATVPFAALLTAPADDYATAPYLLHEWTLTTELAAALIATDEPPDETTEAHPLDVLAFGRSTFGDDRSTWNTSATIDLPNVEREVRRVVSHGDAEMFVDAEATEHRFRQRAGDADVVHLASHAEANATLPLYSRIALREDDQDDGIVHLYELLDLRIDAHLVVLSGCSTAGGGRRGGEGLIGLQYGMRAAGAEATVATLWPVADGATAEIMGAFYDGLADGDGKDRALRDAQRTYISTHDGIEASPFYWAAPVLSGAPTPIPFESGLPWWALGLGAAAVALGAWVAWRLRFIPAHA